MGSDDPYAELCNEVSPRLQRGALHDLQEEDSILLSPREGVRLRYAELDQMGGIWVRRLPNNAQSQIFEIHITMSTAVLVSRGDACQVLRSLVEEHPF